jgi:phage tail-like protein
MGIRSNLQYMWELLPEFMRRLDEEVTPPFFLKRFISFFTQQMDNFDAVIDELHTKVAPETASEEFLNWWLWAFFGWAWFPVWMSLDQKRNFYANVARHYAQRGTARGIVEFLAAFGIKSRVINQPIFYDEFTTDEDEWLVETPLVMVVQIFPQTDALPEELSFYDEWTTDEDAAADPALVPTREDIDALLRFEQPAGHIIIIEEKLAA